MVDAPKARNPTFFDHLSSIFRWILGGTCFVVGACLAILASFFIPSHRLDCILLPMSRWMVRATGLRIRVAGLENVDPSKAYLFLGNHVNFMDHFVIYSVLNRCLRGVEKESNFKIPLYGLLLRRMGQIPIRKEGDTQSAIASMKRIQEVFQKGISLLMMPEGTRTKTGQLGPFKKGAFYLAVDTQAEILPITLVGMYNFNRKGDWHVYPTTVDVIFHPSISAAGMTRKDVPILTERTRSAIATPLS